AGEHGEIAETGFLSLSSVHRDDERHPAPQKLVEAGIVEVSAVAHGPEALGGAWKISAPFVEQRRLHAKEPSRRGLEPPPEIRWIAARADCRANAAVPPVGEPDVEKPQQERLRNAGEASGARRDSRAGGRHPLYET